MLEIYNETIRDLLTPRTAALEVREDPTLGVVVPGLSELEPRDADEVLQLLAQGNSKRTVSATDVNATSSRSHAVLQARQPLLSTRHGAHPVRARVPNPADGRGPPT
jgi:kinesin family member 18/19